MDLILFAIYIARDIFCISVSIILSSFLLYGYFSGNYGIRRRVHSLIRKLKSFVKSIKDKF